MRAKTITILIAALWGLAFALSYAQSPLYTSNQNQYFLHGLAQAGYGDLNGDWLANTADPTPLFSQMVALVYGYLRWQGLFYVIYALLMAVYFFSLWGIASRIFDLHSSSLKRLAFLALLLGLHAAGLRFALARIIGVNWTYIFEDGLADQRLLGPVLQPSAFGVFLLLSIYLFVERRLVLAVLAAVLAAAFHPTYLLSAAALSGAYLLSTMIEARSLKPALLPGGLALLLSAPLALSAFGVFAAAPAASAEAARRILVEYRIPHHALVSWWFDWTAVVKLLLILAALVLVRRTRLFLVMLVCASVAFALTLLQVALDSAALALLFPWRLSTFLLPLSTAVILAFIVNRALDRPALRRPAVRRWIAALSLGLVLLAVVAGAVRFVLDLQRKANEPERLVQAYVAAQRSPEDLYLIPVKMQDFRLESGAPALVDFKSIPYQADEVLEWHRREQLANRFFKTLDCAALDDILESYPVTHVITEVADGVVDCARLSLVNSDGVYRLWQVR